jgi:hypothetical protein
MRPTITLPLLLVLTGCVGAGHQSATHRPPVVKVDDAHYVSSRENHHPERYSIAPSPSIFLDATGYVFKGNSPGLHTGDVERIELLRQRPAGTNRYSMHWAPGKTRYELSQTTLQPATGSPSFEGFRTGERWFVLLGPTYNTNSLMVTWSGVIEVQ